MKWLEEALEKDDDDGEAAQTHLAAGRPIYYWDFDLRANVRKWPNGRREVVEYDAADQLIVVRPLS